MNPTSTLSDNSFDLSRKILLLSLVLTIMTSLVSLNSSLSQGRLSFLATYDDVIYMTDSLKLLDLLQHKGFLAFTISILNDTYHSGLFSGFGAIGYLLFGLHDWAPYIALSFLTFLTFALIFQRISESYTFDSI